jgi:hypothetical protein
LSVPRPFPVTSPGIGDSGGKRGKKLGRRALPFGPFGHQRTDPERRDGPTPSAAQQEPADSVPAQSEAVQGTTVQRQAEFPEVAKPPAALPKRDEEIAFSWDECARQLIDRLMSVVLRVEEEIPEEASIHGLLKHCHLGDHAERLSKRPRKPFEKTEPAEAEKTQRGQDLTPALQVHDPAGVKHPPNHVRIEWEIEARINYWKAAVGTELPVAVRKIAADHVEILKRKSKSEDVQKSRRTLPTRGGK